MELKSQKTIDGGTIHYLGSLNNKNILLIIGRDNFAKDAALIPILIESLAQEKCTIIWYEYESISTTGLFNLENKYSETKRKLIKISILLRKPYLWNYFIFMHFNRKKLISLQTRKLRKFIQSLGHERNVFILSRSSGGRVSSLIEDEFSIKKLVCLGYPFKHPNKSEEFERVKHLEHMKKPFLIIQGTHDEYGDESALQRYILSPHISISFINTDHDFRLSELEWKKTTLQIKSFLNIQ